MTPIRVAVATRCFGEPLKRSLQTASEAGARGVQFDLHNELRPADLTETAQRQLRHRLSELGLSVASLTLPLRRPLYEQEGLEARLQALRNAMELAYKLRSSIVTARIGRVPRDENSVEYGVLCEVLNDLARHANRVGGTLAITPAGDAPQALQQVLSRVTEGPLGIDYDPAGFVLGGHDPLDAVRTLYASILHVRVRDAVRDVDGTGVEVPPGRGEIEWDELLALLDEAGCHGWLTVDRTAGDDKRGDVIRAVQFLQRVAMG